MFFTVKLKSGDNPELAASRLKLNARRRIFMFPMHANEILLDKYIMRRFKTSLKLLCLQITLHAQYSTNLNDEIVVTFIDKRYDDLASLITYGTGKIPGSRILKFALRG